MAGEQCMLLMMRDVTEEKRLAAEARAAERAAALGRVAAGVAHEFNNMLAVIMGRLDLLALNTQDPDTLATLQPAQQAAADGAAMVRRIQSFARAHTGRDLGPVALAGLVQDVLAMTRPQWATPPDPTRPGIGVAVDVPPGLLVHGDATELREVLLNLVLNAVDALPAGGAIRIAAERRADQVVLTVRDTGIGMDGPTQARLFTPFFTTKPQGSGLGLAVVKEIVVGHGGQVRVSSAPGTGSTFEITLPANPGPGGTDPAPAPEPARGGHRVGRVLAIDDDPGLARMLQQMLALAGHEVVTASGGPEGLARLAAEPFDVICTDLGMPGMNGWEVAQRARALAPHVAIVLVTGWDVRVDAATLAHHAVDYVLQKPFRLAAVQEIVARALEGPTGSAALHDSAG